MCRAFSKGEFVTWQDPYTRCSREGVVKRCFKVNGERRYVVATYKHFVSGAGKRLVNLPEYALTPTESDDG